MSFLTSLLMAPQSCPTTITHRTLSTLLVFLCRSRHCTDTSLSQLKRDFESTLYSLGSLF